MSPPAKAPAAPPSVELPGALEWLNAPPQSLRALRGQVVVVGAFNSGSAWSETFLDALGLLQSRFPDTVRVLGLHLPKYAAERDAGTALKAVNRLELGFPVAHDPQWAGWRALGFTAWPSAALIDHRGVLREILVGDGQAATLASRVEALVDEGAVGVRDGARGHLLRSPEPDGALRFPSGLALAGERLYVADTGHHRVLELALDGRIVRSFGSGHPDFLDGPPDEAAFRRPRAVAAGREAIFVADAGNHALRLIDLRSGAVRTLIGHGQPGTPREGKVEDPRETSLHAPWGVAATADQVFLALAGEQQLWRYDLASGRLQRLAGSGRFALEDGVGAEASFGQPAGLALVHQSLYSADAGASAIRQVQLGSATVNTLLGQGPWTHGDADGVRGHALLAGPVAVAGEPGAPVLWIADAGNRSLRRLKLGGGDLQTLALDARLQRPAGLAVADGVLWATDADAHALWRIDTATGHAERVAVGG